MQGEDSVPKAAWLVARVGEAGAERSRRLVQQGEELGNMWPCPSACWHLAELTWRPREVLRMICQPGEMLKE